MNNIIRVISPAEIRNLLHNLDEDERAQILSEEMSQLPIEKRSKIVARQLPTGLSVISPPVSGSWKELSSCLQDLPPETLTQLVQVASEVIVDRVRNRWVDR